MVKTAARVAISGFCLTQCSFKSLVCGPIVHEPALSAKFAADNSSLGEVIVFLCFTFSRLGFSMIQTSPLTDPEQVWVQTERRRPH